jgi:hypothetical protein
LLISLYLRVIILMLLVDTVPKEKVLKTGLSLLKLLPMGHVGKP